MLCCVHYVKIFSVFEFGDDEGRPKKSVYDGDSSVEDKFKLKHSKLTLGIIRCYAFN